MNLLNFDLRITALTTYLSSLNTNENSWQATKRILKFQKSYLPLDGMMARKKKKQSFLPTTWNLHSLPESNPEETTEIQNFLDEPLPLCPSSKPFSPTDLK